MKGQKEMLADSLGYVGQYVMLSGTQHQGLWISNANFLLARWKHCYLEILLARSS